MKNQNYKRSSIKLYLQPDDDINAQLNLFQGMQSVTKSISYPMNQESYQNSTNSFKKIDKKLKINNAASSPNQIQCIDTEGNFLDYAGINLNQLQKTFSMLKYKKQKIKSLRRSNNSSNNNKKFQRSLADEKILKICKNFITKIKRNNIYSPAVVDEESFDKYFQHEGAEGFQMSNSFQFFYSLSTTISIISLIIIQTFVFVFPQLSICLLAKIILIMSAISFLFMILVNSLTNLRINGKKITKLKEINKYYMKQGDFFVDIFMLVMILIQFNTMQTFSIEIILVTFIFKIHYLMLKLSHLEQMIVRNYYYQRYWSLLKIILFNFAFAHIIAILLNLMAMQYPQKNWQTVKGINDALWYQRYVWSYYWAATIMLTVGFGDIVPTTYQEAIWIIFIQIFSCIAFSYNISCLGNLIGIIRSRGVQIDKNIKIFEAMNNKIHFSDDLYGKVEHYINQSSNIKSKFNIAEEKSFIENLPQSYKNQVKCEGNKKLLKPLPFFSSLLTKTIYKLAASMERHIYYPEEIIKPIESEYAIYILQSGKIGCTCKRYDSKYNGIVANEIKLTDKEIPLLLSQQFITKKRLSYQIKSMGYCVGHKLSYSQFIQTLKNIHKDYEFYTFLRDKSKNIIDQYETIKCDICKTNHSYFDCPKYHYLPIKQNIVRKQLEKYKHSKNKRQKFIRSRQQQIQHTLINLNKYKQAVSHFHLSQLANNDNKNMTKNQVQMKKFLVNIYNFDRRLAEISIKSKTEQFIKSMKTIMGIEQCSLAQYMYDFQWIWDVQFDKAANYDIYFPADNSNRLQGKFNVKQKMSQIREKTIKRQILLPFQKNLITSRINLSSKN